MFMIFSKSEMQDELRGFLRLFAHEAVDLLGIEDAGYRDEAMHRSPLWTTVDQMYDYGVAGLPTAELGGGGCINGAYARMEMFFRSLDSMPMKLYLHAYGNALPMLAMRAVQSAVARTVLDGGQRYTDYGIETHGLGKGDAGFLTLAEVALLANMDERSVRNAANPKLPTPLKTQQVGNRSLVGIDEARRWLAGRKGFVPTKASELVGAKVPVFNIMVSEDILDIDRQAEQTGIPRSVLLKAYFEKCIDQLLESEKATKAGDGAC